MNQVLEELAHADCASCVCPLLAVPSPPPFHPALPQRPTGSSTSFLSCSHALCPLRKIEMVDLVAPPSLRTMTLQFTFEERRQNVTLKLGFYFKSW